MLKLLFSDLYQTFNRKQTYAMLGVSVVLYLFFFVSYRNIYPASDVAYWIDHQLNMFYATVIEVMHYYAGFSVDELIHMPLQDLADMYSLYVLKTIMLDYSPQVFLSIFLAPFLFGMDIQNRNLNPLIMQGYSRTKVFFSKILFYYLLNICIDLLIFLVYLGSLFDFSLGQHIPTRYLVYSILIRIYLTVAVSSIPLLVMWLTKNILKASVINLVVAFVPTLLFRVIDVPLGIRALFDPPAVFSDFSFIELGTTALTGQQWFHIVFYPILLMIISISVSRIQFSRYEIE